eukprot:m.28358 g.28358  ORF g.28358 m.28358 type:complete len:302 (-) comp15905_c0_seq1:2095-3000(-)
MCLPSIPLECVRPPSDFTNTTKQKFIDFTPQQDLSQGLEPAESLSCLPFATNLDFFDNFEVEAEDFQQQPQQEAKLPLIVPQLSAQLELPVASQQLRQQQQRAVRKSSPASSDSSSNQNENAWETSSVSSLEDLLSSSIENFEYEKQQQNTQPHPIPMVFKNDFADPTFSDDGGMDTDFDDEELTDGEDELERLRVFAIPSENARKVARGRRRQKQLRQMSTEERKKEVQNKKEKARKSARDCRARKKQYIGKLEKYVKQMKLKDNNQQKEIERLRARVRHLERNLGQALVSVSNNQFLPG